MSKVMEREWYATQVERIYKGYFIRVMATHYEHRWKWFVAPQEQVAKAPNWYNAGKGASEAEARGYSSSCDKAAADAMAMVDSIKKGSK